MSTYKITFGSHIAPVIVSASSEAAARELAWHEWDEAMTMTDEGPVIIASVEKLPSKKAATEHKCICSGCGNEHTAS